MRKGVLNRGQEKQGDMERRTFINTKRQRQLWRQRLGGNGRQRLKNSQTDID